MVKLRPDEKVIMEEDCGEDKIGAGYLILTNQRLTFETGQTRLLTFSKKITQTALDIPLGSISNARTEGWLAKKVVVEVVESSGTKIYKFGVFGTGKWRDSINAAKKAQVSSSS